MVCVRVFVCLLPSISLPGACVEVVRAVPTCTYDIAPWRGRPADLLDRPDYETSMSDQVYIIATYRGVSVLTVAAHLSIS